jgi:diguanylate cyclase (GGDEF)-like protein
VEPASERRHRHSAFPPGRVQKSLHLSNVRPSAPVTPRRLQTRTSAAPDEPQALTRLGAEIRAAAWELALEVVDEGLRDGAVPSLARVGQIGQLGNLPTLIGALGRELSHADTPPFPRRGRVARLVRDHVREREALGFEPREIVTEFLLVGRVLSRFLGHGGDGVDRLVAECVVAYVDRATAQLARRARADPLTDLLNHQAFTEDLELELVRARRYEHGLALVFLDVDRFKAINDTLGHPEGDRVLRTLAAVLRETLRASDLAGRMGGDEFAACLLESDAEAAGRFLSRLTDRLDELSAAGTLPQPFSVSPGVAHFPSDGADADALFRVADARLYELKRARAGS